MSILCDLEGAGVHGYVGFQQHHLYVGKLAVGFLEVLEKAIEAAYVDRKGGGQLLGSTTIYSHS